MDGTTFGPVELRAMRNIDREFPERILARVLASLPPVPGLPPAVADQWQIDALRDPSRRKCLLCARRTGKTEILIAEALAVACCNDAAEVGIFSYSEASAWKILRRARTALGRGVCPYAEAINSARGSIEIRTGTGEISRITAFSGDPDISRGDGLDLACLDEAALLDDAVMTAVRPAVHRRGFNAAGGRILIASTPRGPAGFFYRIWNAGDEDDTSGPVYTRHKASGEDSSLYTPEELAEMRRDMGEDRYAIEILCRFDSPGDAVFTAEELRRIFPRLHGDDDDPTAATPVVGPAAAVTEIPIVPSLAESLARAKAAQRSVA